MAKPILWEDYLYDENIANTTEEHMRATERAIGHPIPEPLRKMMIEHGGQSPTNLLPRYKNGKRMEPDCLFHVHPSPEDPRSIAYTPDFVRTALVEAGFANLIPFASTASTCLCLDYGQSAGQPAVVIIDRDCPPDDPDSRHPQADSIMEFFERYVV